MNQKQIAEALYKYAQKSNHGSPDLSSMRAAERMTKFFFQTMEDAIKKGDSVHVSGFGSLSVVKREARKGVNPRTGEKIKIKARNVVKYKPGASMKQAAAKAKIAKK